MAITLTVTDNTDGTGGVATIAGSTVGTANVLYRAHFQGVDGPLTWSNVGNRTGDGTITVSTGPMRNYYLWYVQNTNGGVVSVSNIVSQALTDTTYEAVRTRCAAAIVDKIKLIDLAEIGATKVYLLNSEKDAGQSWPGVVVMRDFLPDSQVGGTNIRDDIGYPFNVLIQDRADFVGSNAPIGKWDLWKEKVDRAFRNQRLSGVDEIVYCDVEPGRRPAMQPGEEPPQIYLSTRVSLVVRAISREVRGIEV